MHLNVPKSSLARQIHLKHLVAIARRRLLFARLGRRFQGTPLRFRTRGGGTISAHPCAIHRGSWRVKFPDDDSFDHSCVASFKAALDEVRIHGGLPETAEVWGNTP